jgi:hypothetical protein
VRKLTFYLLKIQLEDSAATARRTVRSPLTIRLQSFVEGFWNWKGALIQNCTQSRHIRGLQFLQRFSGGLAA